MKYKRPAQRFDVLCSYYNNYNNICVTSHTMPGAEATAMINVRASVRRNGIAGMHSSGCFGRVNVVVVVVVVRCCITLSFFTLYEI